MGDNKSIYMLYGMQLLHCWNIKPELLYIKHNNPHAAVYVEYFIYNMNPVCNEHHIHVLVRLMDFKH